MIRLLWATIAAGCAAAVVDLAAEGAQRRSATEDAEAKRITTEAAAARRGRRAAHAVEADELLGVVAALTSPRP